MPGFGLKASGTGLSSADFLRPGKIAQVGLDAGRPILDSISGLMGYVSFFENFVQIAVLLFAWIVVLLAFFILAIQLFITLIEFKLTTLAGFVLIPFGLFGKTAFAAERVLGNVISSGVKVLVLAVIVGIGSTLFAQFTAGFGGNQPTIDNAMALVLGALSLLGLGIFGPGIANGHRLWRTATWRRRCRRHRLGSRRHRRRWRRSCSRRRRFGRWRPCRRRAWCSRNGRWNSKCLPSWRIEWRRDGRWLGDRQSAAAHGRRPRWQFFNGGRTAGLGAPHEARADRESRCIRCHPCGSQR